MNDLINGNDLLKNNSKGPLSKIHPALFILITLVTVFITYQIIGGVITILVLGPDIIGEPTNLNLTRIIITFSQFMFILVPVIVLSIMQGNVFKETFRLKKPDILVFILSVLGILVVQPFLQVYLYLQNKLIFSIPFASEILKSVKELFDSLEALTLKLVASHSVPEFIFVVFVIAITPAICEEFLFRGLILKNFERFATPVRAIIFTGLIFALFHFHPFNIVPLAILGIYLTFITFYSGSLYTAIFVHFINNFFSAAAVYIFGKEQIDDPDMGGPELTQFILLGVLSLVLFIAVIKIIQTVHLKKINYNKESL
ncbi:MAG: CPBP family intramembrane metalloprotease [Ignavibacteria bacterium]|nr:CPBP family intramembrane metalloprotease [Ignavibacteria bacterium]